MEARKKRGKGFMVIMGIVGVAVLLIAAVVLRVLYLTGSTKGEAISAYQNPKSALLVIDVQKDTMGNMRYENRDTLIKNVNAAIDYAEEAEIEIIYIRQEYKGFPDNLITGGKYMAGEEGAELAAELSVKSETFFVKEIADTFSSEAFEAYLIEHEIDTLYLVGADSSACVYKTGMGGVNRGYQVIMLEDCLFSANDKVHAAMLEKYEAYGIGCTTLAGFTEQ